MRVRRHRGFTLLEMLAALAVGAVLTVGLVQLVLASMEDSKGQQAAQHQQRVAAAAGKYVAANHAALAAAATATTPAKVTVAELQAGGFLPASHAPANAYGQTPCLLVLQPAPGKLEALLVTEGGPAPIAEKELAFVAANAGPGGGYITVAKPPAAQGAFGSWLVPAAELAHYLSASCSGTPAASGQLATALFYESAATGDFVYRTSVPGHPELNRMTTPLHMAAVAVEGDAADPRCVAADASTYGRIAVDAAGRVLSCQAGTWKGQGSGFWKDPVAAFADLPALDNTGGDVRMVTSLSRAFTWDGAAWKALAVDENGNFSVPGISGGKYLQVTSTETAGAVCTPDGLISKNSAGLILTCQSGKWSTPSSAELAYTETGGSVVMKSNFLAYPAGTVFYAGPFVYDAPEDTVAAVIERDLLPAKDGQIISNVNADMNVGTTTSPTDSVQFTLIVEVVNRDTGAVIATNKAMSPKVVNDQAALAVTLSKAVPKNVSGYRFRMTVLWTTFKGSFAGNFYNRANYVNAAGAVTEMTPLQLNWSIDLTY